MKYFWLIVILSGGLGIGAAWAFNYARFGHREAYFDRMNMDDITGDNVMEIVIADQSNSGAKAELLTEENFHFGVMAPGDQGEKLFRIRNAGTEDLTLLEGASTCKCTIGSFGSSVLKPGEETDIKVSWTVKTQEREFSQRAQVITNDPSRVTLDFQITGEVVRDIEFSPRDLVFKEVATGEPIQMSCKMYSFYDNDIEVGEPFFRSQQMNDLATFTVKPFDPSEEDKEYAKAHKGYEITAEVKSGMRQGAVSTLLSVPFSIHDQDGNYILDDETEDRLVFHADLATTGFITGQLSMVESTKIKASAGGYLFTLGKLGREDSKKARGFIKLKGSQNDNTILTIGEVDPDDVIKAKLGKPINQGTTVLYPLELEIIPGDSPIDMMGKSKGEYGTVWIESDNPKVPKMLIGIKFAVDAK